MLEHISVFECYWFQASMLDDSWVIVNLESEKIMEDVSLHLNNDEIKESSCGAVLSPWTGQRWEKYSGEIPSCKEICDEHAREKQTVWSGQQWSKYV